MKKLLVTGVSGFLGYNVCRAAIGAWDVFGTFHSRPAVIEGVKTLRVDLADKEPFSVVLRDIRPDAVVHCAAYPDPNKCQTDPEASHRTNVQASIAVAALCARHGIPCVFTSTDLVFGGDDPPYSEESPTSPINVYGRHKLAAEQGMGDAYPEVTICRMPLMFGDAIAPAKSFLHPVIDALVNNREIRLFSDEFRTPVSGATAAQGLLLALELSPGLLHLGGRESISRYDFGLLLAKVLGNISPRIAPVLQKDISMPAPRPKDVSLVSEKAFDLGYDPAPLEVQLKELACVQRARANVRS